MENQASKLRTIGPHPSGGMLVAKNVFVVVCVCLVVVLDARCVTTNQHNCEET